MSCGTPVDIVKLDPRRCNRLAAGPGRQRDAHAALVCSSGSAKLEGLAWTGKGSYLDVVHASQSQFAIAALRRLAHKLRREPDLRVEQERRRKHRPARKVIGEKRRLRGHVKGGGDGAPCLVRGDFGPTDVDAVKAPWRRACAT